MRVKVQIKLESEPYSDMFAPIELAHGIPGDGDELVLADAEYRCTRRRFEYDAAGRLTSLTLFVRRSAAPASTL
jgi:YD repeat-containing protein